SLAHCEQTSGVRAAKILISMERQSRLRAEVDGPYLDRSVAAVTLLGHAGAEPTVPILLAIITSEKYPREVRTAAVAGIGRRREGQTALLNLVVQGQLAEELKFAAANVLLSSDQPALQQQAAKYLELPATADNQPLPALSL